MHGGTHAHIHPLYLAHPHPQNAVSQRTTAGRKLRRKVLQGAVMVFVTAGYSGKRFIFEKAHALGVKSIVLDAPDSWARLLEQEGQIAKFVPIDFNDADTVFDQCLAVSAVQRVVLRGLDGAGCAGRCWTGHCGAG